MPKEYTLIGGNGTRVSPLEVNESGTYEAGDSRAFNPVKVNVPSGSTALSGLTDVDITNPTDGQTLVYNAATGKWENGAGGGGNVFNIIGTFADETTTLDKTYAEIKNAYLGGATCIINMEEDHSDPESVEALHGYVLVGSILELEVGAPGQTSTTYTVLDFNGARYQTDSPTGYPVTQK